MADLDRTTAKALVEAGYMPLSVYIQLFGATAEHGVDAPLVPEQESDHMGPFGTPHRVNHH